MLLPIGVGIIIFVVASAISGQFDARLIESAVAGTAFMLAFVAIASWLQGKWIRSRGDEPAPLRESPPVDVSSWPVWMRSVRATAAANLVLFASVFGVVGLLLGEWWIMVFGSAFGIWAAMVWLASWGFRRANLEERGFHW